MKYKAKLARLEGRIAAFNSSNAVKKDPKAYTKPGSQKR
jgi:hypothetical protein